MNDDDEIVNESESKVRDVFSNDRPIVRLLIFSSAAAISSIGSFAAVANNSELLQPLSTVTVFFLLAVLFSFLTLLFHAVVVSEREEGNQDWAILARNWLAVPSAMLAVTCDLCGLIYAVVIFGEIAIS